MALLITLALILMVSSAQGYSLYNQRRELDVLSEAQEATLSVLKESWIPSNSVVFITDGTTPSSTIYKVLQGFEMELNVAFFEVFVNVTARMTHFEPFNLLPHLVQIGGTSRYITLVIISDDDEFLGEILKYSFSNDLLSWPRRLLVVTRLTPTQLQFLRDILSVVNVMVIILQDTPTSKRCEVYMVLPYSHRMEHLGTWTAKFGLTYLSGHHLFPDKFSKFIDGADLNLVGGHFPPHVIIREVTSENDEESRHSFSGALINLLNILATNMNFTYRIAPPADRSWGMVFPNGTWVGMIGQVHRKEVEFALGPIGFTYPRSRVVDFSMPLLIDYLRIQGKLLYTEVNPWRFMMPFRPPLWASTLAALILMIVIVMSLSIIDKKLLPHSSKSSPAAYIRILLAQDIDDMSCSWWERMMMGGWLLVMLIILKSYSCNLVSILAVRYVIQPYQTMRDVVDDSSVTMVWVSNSAYVQYYTSVKSGVFYEVAEAGKRGRIKYITTAELKETVKTLISRGDHVMLNPDILLRTLIAADFTQTGECKYYMSKGTYLPLIFAMALKKKSPLRTAINEGIRGVVESGLYNYWMKTIIPNSTACDNPPTRITIKSSLSIANMWGMFVVLVAGYIISLLVLCLECSCAKFF